MIPKKYIAFLKFERKKKTVLKVLSFQIDIPEEEEKMVKFISLTNICKHNIPTYNFLRWIFRSVTRDTE